MRALATARDIVLTGRARHDAARAFPADLIDLAGEIRRILTSLEPQEFDHAERGGESWVDVYRIDFEDCDLWMKIKIEQDDKGDYVIVISCHEWDDKRPT